MLCVNMEGWNGGCVGGKFKEGEGICIHVVN